MSKSIHQHSSIPVIDLAPARSGSGEDVQTVAKELYQAFKNVGFAYVKNHGVPEDVVEEAFRWSRQFFNLPQSDKDRAPHPPEAWHHRGYSSVGREKVSQMIFDSASLAAARSVPDVKESFDIGRGDAAAPMPNVWPPEDVLPGFRAFFEGFYEVCHDAERELLRLVALGMGLEREYFVGYHSHRDNQIRLLRYPAVEERALREGLAERIAAHTDFGTLTMLFQDDVGGLEVEDVQEKGRFHGVPYIPGTAVVNVGDFLMRWSNDELRSTMHRVTAPPLGECGAEAEEGVEKEKTARERHSIVYFMGADLERTVDCVPGCWGEGRPKRYGPVKCREYIDMRMAALY
ncbi:hypothetical protein J3F83DRAFT_239395 [Trichoderma novae-zelandiae]